MQTTTQTPPKIYVACLAAYNNGFLHGQWIDANQEAEAIHSEIEDMLTQSPVGGAEEWAIHDYEGFFGLRLSESEDIGTIAEIAAMIKECGPAWCAYADHVGLDYATKEGFEEAYNGEWDSEKAFAEDLAGATMEIPKHLECYIDYEKFARDLFISDYFSAEAEGSKVYVFRRF